MSIFRADFGSDHSGRNVRLSLGSTSDTITRMPDKHPFNEAQRLMFQDDLSGISFVIYTLPPKRFPQE